MVEISIQGAVAVFEVQGLHRLWALKSRLEIPLQHIRGVRADPGIAHGWWKGFRLPGTHVPGVIIAGTFYRDGKRIFWDVHRAERAVVVELANERYDALIVEVADPQVAVARLEDARTTVL
ncbi:MAG: hypothetical protein JWQ03_990 [Variovorax sp.]|nr:hypothetical protein [Variovorax sp.]